MKTKKTFKNGNQVFENIDYYSNGKIRKYTFLDEDNVNFLYERDYDTSGHLLNKSGEFFFQGYLMEIDNKTLIIKKGTISHLKIFFPNIPDSEVKLYIKNDDGSVNNVFHKNRFVDCLQTASWDNDKAGTYKLNIWMDFKEPYSDSNIYYNKSLIYKCE